MNTTRWQRWAKRALLGTAAAAALAVMAPNSASAALVYLGEQDLTGTGLGTVPTILTLHDNDGIEQGAVIWNGSTDIKTGDIPPGQPDVQTKTIAAGDLGAIDTLASDLRLVFNADEPQGGGNQSITIDALDLLLFSAAGDPLGVFSLATPLNLPEPGQGIGGNEGDVFGLDAAQAAALQGLLTADARFGLSATLSDAQGGFDTFFLNRITGVIPPPPPPDGEVPEPLTLSLLGSGLAAMGLFGRRRRRRA